MRRTEYVITVWLRDGMPVTYLHTASDAQGALRAGRRHYPDAVAVEVRGGHGGSVLASWGDRSAARRTA